MLLKTSRWVTKCLPFLLKPSLTSPHNDMGGVACPIYLYHVSWFYLPLYELMWLYSCWQSRCPTHVSSSPPQRLLKTPNQLLVPSLPCSSLLTQHPRWSSYSTHLNLSYSCSKKLPTTPPPQPQELYHHNKDSTLLLIPLLELLWSLTNSQWYACLSFPVPSEFCISRD